MQRLKKLKPQGITYIEQIAPMAASLMFIVASFVSTIMLGTTVETYDETFA
jgi:hypothetical protein